jgi:hypothetical protein
MAKDLTEADTVTRMLSTARGGNLLCYFSIRTTTTANVGPIEEERGTRCVVL